MEVKKGKNFVFVKTDLLVLIFIFILLSFGRFLDFSLASDYTESTLDFIFGTFSIKYILGDFLFVFVFIVGLLYFYSSKKLFHHSHYKGILISLFFCFIVTFLISKVSLPDAVIFNISSIILLLILIIKCNTDIKKDIVFYFIILCFAYILVFAYCYFFAGDYIKNRLHSLLSFSGNPVTPFDYLSLEIRNNLHNAKMIGEGFWNYTIKLPLSQYLALFEINPYLLLTYTLFKYGIVFYIIVILIYFSLCARMWFFTIRQKNNILCFIFSSSITLVISIKFLINALSNLGFSYFRTSLVFLSGSLGSLGFNFIFYIIFLYLFCKICNRIEV